MTTKIIVTFTCPIHGQGTEAIASTWCQPCFIASGEWIKVTREPHEVEV